MPHNKNRNLLLDLLINCISARPAPQILYLNDEYAFRFLVYFQIIGLCNFFANCWFDIISLLLADLCRVAKISNRARVTAPPEDFIF